VWVGSSDTNLWVTLCYFHNSLCGNLEEYYGSTWGSFYIKMVLVNDFDQDLEDDLDYFYNYRCG
jgi:hypothetical protein